MNRIAGLKSIRGRLILIILGSIVLSAGSVTYALIHTNYQDVLKQMETNGIGMVKAQAKTMELVLGETNDLASAQQTVEELAKSEGLVYVCFLNEDFVDVVDSQKEDVGSVWDDENNRLAVKDRKIGVYRWTDEDGVRILAVALPVDFDIHGEKIKAMEAGLSLEALHGAQTTAIYRGVGIMVLFIVVFALLAYLLLNVNVIKPLLGIKDELLLMARGDLTGGGAGEDGKTEGRADELGDLARAAGEVRQYTRSLVALIQQYSDTLKGTAAQLAAQIHETAQGTTHAAATMQEMAAAIDGVTRNIGRIDEAARDNRRVAAAGNEKMTAYNRDMQGMQESTRVVSGAITELDQQTAQINHIVEAITGIAEQTNLLALNASIEAARVGEAGKGFAVVADEVRKLAEESAHSARTINDQVRGIREKSLAAVQNVADNQQLVAAGIVKAREVGRDFEAIVRAVEGLGMEFQSLTAAAREMGAGIQTVTAGAEEQSAVMDEISKITEQMNRIANQLNDECAKFKV